MKTILAVIAAIVAVIALLYVATVPNASPPEMTQAEREAIAEELHQLNLQLNQLGEANDVEGMMEHWVADPSAYFVGEPASFLQSIRLLNTKDDIRAFFTPMTQTRASTNFTVLSDHVAVLSPTLAVQVLEQKYSITDTLGNTGPEFPETATTVWVKEDGAWKMLHFHQSWSNTPIEESGSTGQ